MKVRAVWERWSRLRFLGNLGKDNCGSGIGWDGAKTGSGGSGGGRRRSEQCVVDFRNFLSSNDGWMGERDGREIDLPRRSDTMLKTGGWS